MKKQTAARLIHMLIAVTLCLVLFGWPAAVCAGLINWSGMPGLLGTSYPVPNSSTVTDLTTLTPKARQELWVKSVIFGADMQYQECPFADGMMGGKFSGKAIIQIRDTEKVNGNTVNIPLMGGFGGPGVQGEGTRIGNEQKLKVGNLPVQIGRFWFGYSWTAVARDETIIGGPLDQWIRSAMRAQFAKKKNDDIMMMFIKTANANTQNLLFPAGITSRANLSSTDVMSTALISRGALHLSTQGAKPMEVSKDTAGSTKKQFMLLSTDQGLLPLETEDAFLNAYYNADVRGSANGIWTGNYKDWMGQGLYRWNQIDHGNQGSIGSPLLPRARLGVAVTIANNAVIQGGGSNAAAAATPLPNYFEFFSNAPYTFHNGQTIAADTTTQRYIRLTNPDGSVGVGMYTVNTGGTITLNGVATVTGATQTAFVVGAIIQECNANGIPFGRHLYFGQEAMAAGQGSIDGTPANPQYGRRTEEILNHGMNYAVGCEQSWGCAPIPRWDGIFPGFVVLETAIPQIG